MCAHGAMALGLGLLVPGFAGASLAALALALGVASAADRALLLGRHAPRCIEIRGDGAARLLTAEGRSFTADRGAGRAGRSWAVVRVASGRRRSVLVTAGMLDAEGFRRLRLWVFWGRHGAETSPIPAG